MFTSNRQGLILNLIFTIGIVVVMNVTILISKFFPLIAIISLSLSYYFVYFAVQVIISILTMRILPAKDEEKVEIRNSYLRPRKDVTDSL